MRRGVPWFAFSFLTALSACEDEVVQVYFPTDASADRAAEAGSAHADAGASADGDAAEPAADATVTDDSPAPVDAQTGDAETDGEPQLDDDGETDGD